MALTYGYDLKQGDKIMEAPVQLAKLLVPLVRPGAALVNYFPFCALSNFFSTMSAKTLQQSPVQHIPSWVPYFSYKPVARKGRELSRRIRNEPIDFVKNALVCGGYVSSLCIERYCVKE
jgi:hypothetical protein